MRTRVETRPNEAEFADGLKPGTVLLRGQYVIESYLVSGGFGNTYLARDSLERVVVIKECFPGAICCRSEDKVFARSREQQEQYASILRHFIREARRLSKLSHPDIVGVHQVFEENGTAYMALDFVDGSDLLTVLETEMDRLTPDVIGSILHKSLEAISYVHDEGILHRDISPDNILLDQANSLTLIDFGAAREHASKKTRALSALLTVKDGYSPQEFYLSDEVQRPSSDIYSLGATFYHIITGEAPPHSQQRLSAVATRGDDPYVPLVNNAEGFSKSFLAAIDKSLEIFPVDRFQSARDWIGAIDGSLHKQSAKAKAKRDAGMRRTISELIQDTSIVDLTVEEKPPRAGRPVDPRPRGAKSRQEPDIETPQNPVTPERQFVDMFGDPVQDVDAWLKSQERSRAKKPKVSNTSDKPGTRRGPPKNRFLRALLGRVAPQHFGSIEN